MWRVMTVHEWRREGPDAAEVGGATLAGWQPAEGAIYALPCWSSQARISRMLPVARARQVSAAP